MGPTGLTPSVTIVSEAQQSTSQQKLETVLKPFHPSFTKSTEDEYSIWIFKLFFSFSLTPISTRNHFTFKYTDGSLVCSQKHSLTLTTRAI